MTSQDGNPANQETPTSLQVRSSILPTAFTDVAFCPNLKLLNKADMLYTDTSKGSLLYTDTSIAPGARIQQKGEQDRNAFDPFSHNRAADRAAFLVLVFGLFPCTGLYLI